MLFKKIEMIGFKSFADRTVIEFNDNFTAIVGPNGCGKSNVSDAIRWVLGEQSPKSLRGDSMQDVIFNGTEKRRSLSYCEVTLTFDNSSRFFNFDYNELAITRKLYRSGESEYLINRNTCHLKDITNLLFNSGLGKNGYSVVGQGKVTEIVDAKPENRRAMFEDAAGISKYKSDKQEAERKLERTRDNLTRVNDIVAELDRQMGPLKKQAENARKYLEYKSELKDLEVNAYIYQFENASNVKQQIGLKLRAIEEQLSMRQQEFEKANENYNKSMMDLNNFDKILASLNETILQLTVTLEKQEGETKLARERINYTIKENDRLKLDNANCEKSVMFAEEQKARKEQEKKALSEKLVSLEAAFDDISNSYSLLASEVSLNENEAGASQQKIIDTLGSLTDVKSSVSRLMAEQGLLSSSLENLNKDVLNLNSKKVDSEILAAQMKSVVSEKEIKLEVLKQDYQNLVSKNYINENRLKEFEGEKANITTQIKVYENRKKLLTDLQTDYEGYAYAIKKLLKESERNNEIKSKIVGVVASLIKVPQKFETAIEVALGGAVQNVITYDENGAKSLIEYLKNNQFGRATFLPITSMKRRDIESKSFIGKPGVFGVASELVDFDSKIDNVVSNLLGGTVIVDTLSTAVNLAKSFQYSFRIVTLDGDVVNPQGSLTGGSKKSSEINLMGRAREIETLGAEIVNLNKKIEDVSAQINNLSSSSTSEKSRLNIFQQEINSLSIELAKDKEKLGAFENTLFELADNLQITQMEAKTVENKLKLIYDELSQNEKIESALSGNRFDADELVKEKKARFEQLRIERDNLSNNLMTVKIEIASIKSNFASVESELLRLNDEILKQNNLMVSLKVQIDSNDKFIEDAEAMIKEKIAAAPSSQTKQQLENMFVKRNEIEQSKFTLSDNIKKLDAEKSSLMEEISHVNDKKFREEMNLSKVDTELEQMQERIYEEYSLTYQNCLDLRRPDFEINVAMPEINKRKKEIAALGYVNVNAIEDCKALLERYEDLSSQCQDLSKAEEDLTKIIKDLSSIMIEKFNNELDHINESFKLTFKELFGGGTAKLTLSDETNPLVSGVEIYAQPPGKKIQNMTLLSGGEKSLTAMAVIFAILRIKPLPFCLFDEVEAALDDSNVEIVDKYLKKLSTETQFILITHKKPTMEYAEALFGVTMEEKGVSKVVSVKLSEAIKQIQEN